jgi:hypothetical protein
MTYARSRRATPARRWPPGCWFRTVELPIRTFAPPEILLLDLVRPDSPAVTA